MKKFFKTIALTMATLALSTCFIGCNVDNSGNDDTLTYLCMRINPEIEVVVDEDNVVVSVNAINEDGETVLSDLTLVGESVEDAAEAFTDKATELGFIDVTENENALYISADGTNEEIAQEIEQKVTDKVNKYFENRGIFGKVHLENFEEFQALANEWNIDIKEVKIVLRIQEMYPEMTLEEILALDFQEKLDLIKENHKNNGIPFSLLEEYRTLIENLNSQFEEMFNLKEQIKEYKEQLKNLELSATEKEFIEGVLTTLESQFETFEEQYKTALEQIKVQLKEKLEQIKLEIQSKVDNRKNENRQKIEDHRRDFELRKEQIKQEVKEWQQNGRK